MEFNKTFVQVQIAFEVGYRLAMGDVYPYEMGLISLVDIHKDIMEWTELFDCSVVQSESDFVQLIRESTNSLFEDKYVKPYSEGGDY